MKNYLCNGATKATSLLTTTVKMRSKQLAKLSKKYQDGENLFHQTVTREGEEK